MPTEKIRAKLVEKFSYPPDKIKIQRAKRIWVEAGKQDFHEVLEYLYKELDFKILCTITGLDAGESLLFIYHLSNQDGIIVNLKRIAPKQNPVITTVTGRFPGASFYERELEDLLGAKVEGLAPGHRYPLPDTFPAGQHPLLKDWKGLPPENEGKEEKKV